jgi:hypothetical protein
MCPFCFATLGLVVAGTVSTGGLTALALKLSRMKSQTSEIIPDKNERSHENSNTHGR